MPVIPATQEAEIRRITVQGQTRQEVSKNFISTKKLGGTYCTPSYMEA
jgi:hypothetical protein